MINITIERRIQLTSDVWVDVIDHDEARDACHCLVKDWWTNVEHAAGNLGWYLYLSSGNVEMFVVDVLLDANGDLVIGGTPDDQYRLTVPAPR